MSRQALKEVGLRAWDEPDGHGRVLMLLPGEWYQHIPRGYEIVDINGNAERFEPGVTDDDIRFGCLAYGIVIVEGGDRGLREAGGARAPGHERRGRARHGATTGNGSQGIRLNPRS